MFRVSNSCPACLGASDTIHERPYSELTDFLSHYYDRPVSLEGTYRLNKCRECQTVFQAFRPCDALLADLYGNWISLHVDAPNERDRHEIASVQAFLGRKKIRTLDFGMGSAAWAIAAKELGCESCGVDVADDRMTHARERGIITSDNGTFDFINAEQVFEHLVSPRDEAKRLRSKLAPGGILKISVPSAKKLDLTAEPPAAVHPLEHLNCFTDRGLRNMVDMPEVRPSFIQRFARPPASIKEVVRPFWTWRNPNNLYRWFQR